MPVVRAKNRDATLRSPKESGEQGTGAELFDLVRRGVQSPWNRGSAETGAAPNLKGSRAVLFLQTCALKSGSGAYRGVHCHEKRYACRLVGLRIRKEGWRGLC